MRRGRPSSRPSPNPPAPQEGPYRLHPDAWLVALGLLCGFLIDSVNANVTSVASGYMAGTVAATPDEISGASTGYGGAKLVMFLVTPWLLARWGSRRVLTGAMLAVTAAMVGCGFSHGLFDLIFWRVVQGAGGAVLAVGGQAVLVQSFPNRLMGYAQCLWALGVVMALPGITAAGGYLAEYQDWSWAFFLAAPLGLIGTALLWRYADGPGRDAPPAPAFDWITLALAGTAAVSLQYVLQQGERYNWLDEPLIAFFAALAAVASVLTVAWLLAPRNRHPLVDLGVMRIFMVMLPVSVTVISGAATNGSSFVYPGFVEGVAGFGAADAGRSELPSMLTIGLGLALSTWAIEAHRINPLFVTLGGFLVFADAMWMMGHTSSASGYPDIGADWTLRGLALGMQTLTLLVIMITATPRRQITHVLALYNFSRQLSGSVGTAAVATALEHLSANNRSVLVSHLYTGSSVLSAQVSGLSARFVGTGEAPVTGPSGALATINGLLEKQVAATAYDDIFLGLAVFMLIAPFTTVGVIVLIRALIAKLKTRRHAAGASA